MLEVDDGWHGAVFHLIYLQRFPKPHAVGKEDRLLSGISPNQTRGASNAFKSPGSEYISGH